MAQIVEMPKLGFDMAEGTLVNWVKSEGDPLEKGEILAEIETDKATVEVESPYSGVLYKQLVAANSTVPIGSPIAVISDKGETVNLEELVGAQPAQEEKKSDTEEVPVSPAPVPAVEETQPPSDDTGRVKASPLAKRIASEQGITLAAISGSGPGGRIVKRDIERAQVTPSLEKKSVSAPKTTPALAGEEIEISKLRAAIGRRMLESRQGIPHFTITDSYDVGDLLKLRAQFNRDLPDEEKISVNDLIVKAVALALREFPNLNASLSGSRLVRHGGIHIGIAVAVDDGLLTVVLRDADSKDLSLIASETREMVARVRSGKIRSEDVEGSTFTISNLGMFNVEDFEAIINPPEAAILAVASAQEVPIVENGQLAVGWRMKATIAADHRITDGAEAARFMQHLAVYLEEPWRLV